MPFEESLFPNSGRTNFEKRPFRQKSCFLSGDQLIEKYRYSRVRDNWPGNAFLNLNLGDPA